MTEPLEDLGEWAPPAVADDGFSERIARQTSRLKTRRLIIRLASGALIAVAATPLREYGLMLSELALMEVVTVPRTTVSALLAPINSVGALLATALFAVRLAYRRLFG